MCGGGGGGGPQKTKAFMKRDILLLDPCVTQYERRKTEGKEEKRISKGEKDGL